MPERPTPYRYALTEPAHVIGLLVWLIGTGVLFLTGSDYALYGLGAGAVLEGLYLGGFARTDAYRRRAAIKAARSVAAKRLEERAARAGTLRKQARKRYRAIEKLHREVVRLLEEADRRGVAPLEVSRETLDDILDAALDFCTTLQTIRNTLEKSPIAPLKDQLAQWEAQAGAKTGNQGDTAEAKALLARRIAYLEDLEAKAESLRAQLATIEQTLMLLKEQLPTLDVQAGLDVDIGQLVSSVETTRETVREVGALQAQSLVRAGR